LLWSTPDPPYLKNLNRFNRWELNQSRSFPDWMKKSAL
jgi:hypothetical protein